MISEYPISQNLVQTFRNAIVTLWSGDDPIVFLDGKQFSIGEIADRASDFDDPMPEDVYAYLCVVAAMVNKRPADKTFAAGGRCLRRLYDDLVRRRAEIWE
jgi:hypothetical protein